MHNQPCQPYGRRRICLYHFHYRLYKDLTEQYDSKQNVFGYAVDTYETCFGNNIAVPMYKRLDTFLRNFQVEIQIQMFPLVERRRNTICFADHTLFNADLINELRNRGWTEPLHNLEQNNCKAMRLLYKIQRFNEDHQLPNFTLLPIFK